MHDVSQIMGKRYRVWCSDKGGVAIVASVEKLKHFRVSAVFSETYFITIYESDVNTY